MTDERRLKKAIYDREYRASHKEQTARTGKAYKDAHKEANVEHNRDYYAEHKDERKQYNHDFHLGHREEIALRHKNDRLAHPEEHAANCRAWAAVHKRERRVYMKALLSNRTEEEVARDKARSAIFQHDWQKKNRDKTQVYGQKHRALKYANTPVAELLTEPQWLEILNKYRHRCAYCGVKSEHLTMDHVVPLSRGGKHSADNVIPACKHCNCAKRARTPEEWSGLGVAA